MTCNLIPLPGLPLSEGADAANGVKAVLGVFVMGPENAVVEVAVRAVMTGQTPQYNPIVFYGPSGTGKSHLARGLLQAYKNQFSDAAAGQDRNAAGRRTVVYAAASDFARELNDAFETNGLEDFRAKYRTASVLAVEDLARLADKAAAQEELASTIDMSVAAGRRVILTASVAPEQLSGLQARLIGRLVAGLAVPLVPPGLEARIELIRRFAEVRRIPIEDPAVTALAEGLPVTAGVLMGSLMQLWMNAEVEGRANIDAESVRQHLAERSGTSLTPVQRIAQLTAKHFALRVQELRGPSRRQGVVTARGVAMYLARLLSQQSLEQIGHYFGGRDHTTVLHACRKTAALARSEPGIHKAVAELKEKLSAR